MLAAYVADPAEVTPALMDRWAKDFDNWATCDTLCFVLFDRSPHAWTKIRAWSRRREEFVKRAAFALLAGVALHDKTAPDTAFLRSLPLIERAARDDRNYVKKGVSWALRSIGHRSRPLHAAAMVSARRLAESTDRPSRWVGHDVLRDLTRPLVEKKLAAREARLARATSSR
jgi:3-methyladenine DNA glycosylase AlkD